MKYVVLGMHKSGTTLISKTLHDSGVDMVDNTLKNSYDEGNKYERTSFLLVNTALLDIKFSRVSWNITEVIREPKVKKSTIISLANYYVTNLNNRYSNWGFKDPRTCLTYNFWKKHLGEHLLIGVYRSPFEVLNHYTSKQRFGWIRLVLIFKVLRSWYIYNSEMLSAIKSSGGIIISYEGFMKNPNSVIRLSKFLGLKLKDLRNKSLRRSQSKITYTQRLVYFFLKVFYKKDVNALVKDLETEQVLYENQH